MFPVIHPSQPNQVEVDQSAAVPSRLPDVRVSECHLATVLQLREEVLNGKHEGIVMSILLRGMV
jgi:hypothetical protein